MESTNNNNNNQMLFGNELSAVKKRIVQLEKSHEKQQERIDILERENHMLKKKTELNNLNGNKAGESKLKRKRTDQHQVDEEVKESKPASVSASAGKKKTKTNNNNDDDEEAVMILRDNGDSFDSLSDDLLHRIVEFDGNCYTKFGLINKRCKNIYDVEEYKLKKQTCVYGYGTLDMILPRYLQKRRERRLNEDVIDNIVKPVIWYNRLDAIEWIIQLEDKELLRWLCLVAAYLGRINILTKVFCKCNVTMLDDLLNDGNLCYQAAYKNKLETLKWLRKYGANWDAWTFSVAREVGRNEILHYLRAQGCPEPPDS